MVLIARYDADNAKTEIGVDEVGRGPMFGRVYCAAVILPNDKTKFKHELMKDSKKFTSKKKIEEVAEYIKANCVAYSVGYVDERVIDEINIKNATHKAMHIAVKNIIKYDDDNLLLIDGSNFTPITYLQDAITIVPSRAKGTWLQLPLASIKSDALKEVPFVCIIGGDNKYSAIAAASIIAKVERDKYIYELCDKYPKLDEYYDLRNNKGYGTAKHMEGIKKYGITEWHRKSFGICKEMVKTNSM